MHEDAALTFEPFDQFLLDKCSKSLKYNCVRNFGKVVLISNNRWLDWVDLVEQKLTKLPCKKSETFSVKASNLSYTILNKRILKMWLSMRYLQLFDLKLSMLFSFENYIKRFVFLRHSRGHILLSICRGGR